LISVSSEPVLLANQPRKLAVPANLGGAEKSTGGRDLPVERNLPIKDTSQGTSSTGIPPQGASNYSKPMEGGDLKLVASKVVRLHLGKNKLFGSTMRAQKR
jgi:hypothetical protein